MVEKYIYKTIDVIKHQKIVHYGANKSKEKFKIVYPYKRKQRFLNPEYVAHQHAKKHGLEFKSGTGTGKYKDMLANQVLHQDWSHMSEKYPNIIGLTDLEINTFLEQAKTDPSEISEFSKIELEQYLKKMKCYNDNDLTLLSQEMYDEWDKKMHKWFKDHATEVHQTNDYKEETTIYVTSPRGGHEILTIFSYANYKNVHKKNVPFDWSKSKAELGDHYSNTLQTSSLPYSYNTIKDVNDIVFLDDVFMSGEQFNSALITIKDKLRELNIKHSELPRIHYMAIAGNMPRVKKQEQEINKLKYYAPNNPDELKWFSITIGDKRKFDYHYSDPYPYTSGCVFPFSIPDGQHHKIARKLYDKFHKFPHRKFSS